MDRTRQPIGRIKNFQTPLKENLYEKKRLDLVYLVIKIAQAKNMWANIC